MSSDFFMKAHDGPAHGSTAAVSFQLAVLSFASFTKRSMLRNFLSAIEPVGVAPDAITEPLLVSTLVVADDRLVPAAPDFRASTRNPVSPSSTASGRPPTRVANHRRVEAVGNRNDPTLGRLDIRQNHHVRGAEIPTDVLVADVLILETDTRAASPRSSISAVYLALSS